MSTKAEYLQKFIERPVAILCQDDSRVTGIVTSVNSEKKSILLRQVTSFHRNSEEKSSMLFLNISHIRNLFCLPSNEKMAVAPDLSDFPRSTHSKTSKPGIDNSLLNSSFKNETSKSSAPEIILTDTKESDYYDSGVSRGERFKYPQPLYGRQVDNHPDTLSYDKYSHDPLPSEDNQTPVFISKKNYKDKKFNKTDKFNKNNIYYSDENTSSYEKPLKIRSKHKPKKEKIEWCTDDIIGPGSAPFDFQKTFELFDKEKDFAEFKQQDSIPFQERLVGHNLKNPNRRNNQYSQQPTQYLRNDENVLDDYEFKNQRNYSNTKMDTPISKDSTLSVRDKFYLKTERGVTCPKIDWRALLEIKRLSIIESRCTEEQFYENSGRTIALMVLKALDTRHNNLQKTNALPSIIILAGDNETGAYSFSASRHLANRGFQVYIISVSNNSRAYKYYHSLTCAGVQIVAGLEEIPGNALQHVGLVIDSLLGVDNTLTSLSDPSLLFKTINLIKWANTSEKPILSIGVPSGLTENQGSAAYNPDLSDCIQPWWTLCLGAPTSVLTNSSLAGDIYLGDIGIPSSLWKRIGIDWKIPYDSSFIVRLNF